MNRIYRIKVIWPGFVRVHAGLPRGFFGFDGKLLKQLGLWGFASDRAKAAVLVRGSVARAGGCVSFGYWFRQWHSGRNKLARGVRKVLRCAALNAGADGAARHPYHRYFEFAKRVVNC
jgi:hypothetical protein